MSPRYASSQNKLANETLKIETKLEAALSAGVISDLNDKVQALTAQISERPSETEVERMLSGMQTELKAQFGDSRAIQIILENLKMDLRRKVTKGEVLGYVKSTMDGIKDR